jgi:hypothetical protein
MFLSKQEKNELKNKIQLYQLRREKNPITYSLSLNKFFIRRKKEGLIEKTKSKKIKEEKLLSMKQKDIVNLGFLTEEERKELLSLLAEYKKQKN